MKSYFEKVVAIVLATIMTCGTSHAGLITGADLAHIALAQTCPSVGWLEADGGFRGTGVLIDRHWVLFSAHQMFADPNNPSSAQFNSYRFGLGNNYFSSPGESMTASQVFWNPSFAAIGTGYDQALLYFENPFLTVDPVDLYRGSIEVGMQGDIAGYGVLQAVGSPTQTLTGDRRAGTDLINEVGFQGPNFFSITLDHPVFGDASRNLLQMKGTPGDSGGGFFINGELAGTTSFASLGSNFGTRTSFTMHDLQWIDTTTSSVPEPSSCLLLLMTLIPAAMRRTRSV